MENRTIAYVVAVGVADVRCAPDPASELVTQALMNAPAALGDTVREWTYVTLKDYEGGMLTDELEEPIGKGFSKIGECCGTALHLVPVINPVLPPLYTHVKLDDTAGHLYLSTSF